MSNPQTLNHEQVLDEEATKRQEEGVVQNTHRMERLEVRNLSVQSLSRDLQN